MRQDKRPDQQPGYTRRSEWRAELEARRAARDAGAAPCETCRLPMLGVEQLGSFRRHAHCRARCEQCGGLYEPYGKSRYCSADCRRKATSRQRFLRRNRGTSREGIGGAV